MEKKKIQCNTVEVIFDANGLDVVVNIHGAHGFVGFQTNDPQFVKLFRAVTEKAEIRGMIR